MNPSCDWQATEWGQCDLCGRTHEELGFFHALPTEKQLRNPGTWAPWCLCWFCCQIWHYYHAVLPGQTGASES